jgi:hypothetical protein
MTLLFVIRSLFFALPLNRLRQHGHIRRRAQCLASGAAVFSFFLFTADASAQSTYRDPNGNFTVDVPAGWHAESSPQGSEVSISKGNASVTFDVGTTKSGSTPPLNTVLDALEKEMMKECPQAEVLRRGDTSLAGQAGVFVQVACRDPQRGTAILTVSAAIRSGQIFVCNTSSLSSEYSSVKPVVDGIVKSFRVGIAEAGTTGAGSSNQDSRKQANAPSGADAEKLRALEDACASGVLTPDECAAKRAALKGGGHPSGSSDDNPKLLALEKACKAGVFSAEECAAKRAAILAGGPSEEQNGNQTPASAGWTDYNASGPANSSNPPADNNGGTVYSEPHGAFKLVIPQGWTAKTKSGCYGPSRSCPPDSAGVNIYQGNSWAFVALYSANARQPTDVVNGVAGQYQSQYQNLKMIQNEPQKFGGLDIALGQFTGVDQSGTTVSLVVIGIAAPNRSFYVACSSVALSDAQTAGPALSSMLQTLQFAGQ